ncbi:hypothetical protein EYF80_024608 [Liparis tanakae]|uniref:Uncharacterized protein n=1 Tax=Liparis tanakae TaxID=230148 RepID=A0A4Z2HHX6_9TELE|nr:hypothetical protein EYF80_024608 [Liparis tanakae]
MRHMHMHMHMHMIMHMHMHMQMQMQMQMQMHMHMQIHMCQTLTPLSRSGVIIGVRERRLSGLPVYLIMFSVKSIGIRYSTDQKTTMIFSFTWLMVSQFSTFTWISGLFSFSGWMQFTT